jgi:hypothetical protein
MLCLRLKVTAAPCRSPVAQEHRELSTAGVWWLPYSMTLAGSCEAIVEEADKLLAISTTADHVLPPNAGHQVNPWCVRDIQDCCACQPEGMWRDGMDLHQHLH